MNLISLIVYFFIPLLSLGQIDSLDIISIDESFHLHKTNTLKFSTPITAHDVGTTYLGIASDGKISIYDLTHNNWRTQGFIAFTTREVDYANLGRNTVTSKEINLLKIDNRRNKVGYTLKYAIFKDIEINTLKTDILTWQSSANIDLVYLKQEDGYARFTKFYPDEQSMNGELDIYFRKDIDKKTHSYQKRNGAVANTLLPKISDLKLNKFENIYGAKTYDHKLILWDKSKPLETNVFVNDTLKLISFDFKGDDNIIALYNNGVLYTIPMHDFKSKQEINSTMANKIIVDSFIYNANRAIFVGSINHSEIVLFKINNQTVEIITKLNIHRTFKDYKISEDGKWLSIF